MVGLLVLLFVAGWAGWLVTDPKIRAAMHKGIFNLSDEQVRQFVNRPYYLAGLKAVRVMGCLLLLSVAVLEAVGRPDLSVWFLIGSVVGTCLLTLCLVQRS